MIITQRVYVKKSKGKWEKNYVFFEFLFYMVNSIGVEPITYSLEGCCSVQLSYESKYVKKSNQLQALYHITIYTSVYPSKLDGRPLIKEIHNKIIGTI